MERRAEGARELILAIFRLAVADYLGLSYGHDRPGRRRHVHPGHRADAGHLSPYYRFRCLRKSLAGGMGRYLNHSTHSHSRVLELIRTFRGRVGALEPHRSGGVSVMEGPLTLPSSLVAGRLSS